jgi:hypothetical protein
MLHTEKRCPYLVRSIPDLHTHTHTHTHTHKYKMKIKYNKDIKIIKCKNQKANGVNFMSALYLHVHSHISTTSNILLEINFKSPFIIIQIFIEQFASNFKIRTVQILFYACTHKGSHVEKPGYF